MELGAVIIIGLTIVLIVRRYQTQAVLFLSGFSLLILAWIHHRFSGEPVPGLSGSGTGWFGFDLFQIVQKTFSTRAGGIGMIIM